jgi:hypothetical protein
LEISSSSYFSFDVKQQSLTSLLIYQTLQQKNYRVSISMTKIVHVVKGGLLSYCDKVYLRGNINQKHRIGGVMVCVLASSAVDRGFEPQSGQTKDYKIGICCFSAKPAILWREQVIYQ